MLLVRLAFKNTMAAGVRTWLNTFILSLTFVFIILINGIHTGMYLQIVRARIADELGGGQYWHADYDPFDPFSLEESHAPLPLSLQNSEKTVPILVVPATIYPHGQMQSVVLKGISPEQSILQLPTSSLKRSAPAGTIPVMIGMRMARDFQLSEGDTVAARWRTHDGAFDAMDFAIVSVFKSDVQAVDQGQLWIPLENLQRMVQTPNHATFIVLRDELQILPQEASWQFHSLEDLLADTRLLVESKRASAVWLYAILMLLAMLAIFDTQALSVFRRHKELGTLMALGLTPSKVVQLITLEGCLHGILAAILATVYGGPVFWYLGAEGYPIPVDTEQFGLALGERMVPVFSVGLFAGTFGTVMLFLAVISYWPARKIAKLQPSDALRGRSY
ncbi:MAG: ABC transporter permease [SAR324 cluster bacterium]|nr:ABC transporter permease [SAR324 cluster bacterium]